MANPDSPPTGAGRNATDVIASKLERVTFFNMLGGSNATDKKPGDSLDPDALRVQFNPTSYTERVSVNYGRQTVPGMSHQVMQFVNTNNMTVDMELFFRAVSPLEVAQNLLARRRLMSWCYPTANSGNVSGGTPPTLLVIWPNMLSFQAYLTNVEFNHARFHPSMASLQFTARVTFEEVVINRMTWDEVDSDGTRNRFDSGSEGASGAARVLDGEFF